MDRRPASPQARKPSRRYRRTVALLNVNNLRITLPTTNGAAEALRGVSFSIKRGQTLGLMGESGCGKSITALALMGLLPEGAVASGSVQLDGTELLTQTDKQWCQLRGARLAMVFQEPMTALNPLHTIGQQIAEPLRLHKHLSHSAARAEALRLLTRVRMPQATQRLDAYPHQLSGGQRQRVVLAIALACGPDLLIADEPTTALDASLQNDMLLLLQTLTREDGMALLLISHDLGVMARTVQNLLVMYAGQVVEQGPTAAVFEGRAHPYTRGLYAARPRLGLPRGTRLATIPGRVPSLSDRAAFLLRPGLQEGCAFADRCPQVMDRCRSGPPPMLTVAPEHQARCVLAATTHAVPMIDTHLAAAP
jgi:peptide/nickel transport system ATP-binding protein